MPTASNLQPIADRINTGLEDTETTRALVVFNCRTDGPLSCSAVFPVAMSWLVSTPFPPVTVTDENGSLVASAVRFYRQSPDIKGRKTHCHVWFELWFDVCDVPQRGWKTYIAAYTEVPGPLLTEFHGLHGLLVVETTRHGGDLPRVGELEPGV